MVPGMNANSILASFPKVMKLNKVPLLIFAVDIFGDHQHTNTFDGF